MGGCGFVFFFLIWEGGWGKGGRVGGWVDCGGRWVG